MQYCDIFRTRISRGLWSALFFYFLNRGQAFIEYRSKEAKNTLRDIAFVIQNIFRPYSLNVVSGPQDSEHLQKLAVRNNRLILGTFLDSLKLCCTCPVILKCLFCFY